MATTWPGPITERGLEVADGRSYSEAARREAVDRAIELRSMRAAAAELGVGMASIRNWAKDQGRSLSGYHRNGYNAEERARAVALIGEVGCVREVARREGVTAGTLSRWCEEAGVEVPSLAGRRLVSDERRAATAEYRRAALRARQRARWAVCVAQPSTYRAVVEEVMAEADYPRAHTPEYQRVRQVIVREVARLHPRVYRRLLNAERAVEGLPPQRR